MADPRPIFEAENMAEAEIVCELLRAEGIKCGARDVSTASNPLAWNVGGGDLNATAVMVFVDESDVDRAEEILADWPGEPQWPVELSD